MRESNTASALLRKLMTAAQPVTMTKHTIMSRRMRNQLKTPIVIWLAQVTLLTRKKLYSLN